MPQIFWVVGDKSGDLHSAKVIEKSTGFEHIGIGGPHMSEKGFRSLFPFERFNIMGFAEVLKHLPFIFSVEKKIKQIFATNPPDLVVLVDFPGLNFRIAEIAYKYHIRILYYIAPQFWAWRHDRIYQMKRFCDHIASIFPFEKELLDIHGINSTYVGHPVIEEIEIQIDKLEFAKFYELDPDRKWIAFFPGSRLEEVKTLLPIYLEAIKRLKKSHPQYHFLISKSRVISSDIYSSFCPDMADIHFIDGYNYEMMKYSDFLLVKSGTTTVEAGLIGTPFAIIYKTTPLSYYIAKKLIRVKYIGMPNIILNRPLIPELIQGDATPEKIIDTISCYIDSPDKYQELASELSLLKSHLGTSSASQKTADIISNIIVHGGDQLH